MARRPSELPWIEALHEARGDQHREAGPQPSPAPARAGRVPLSRMDRPIEQHRWTRRRTIAIAAVLLGVAALAFGYARYGSARTLTLSRDRVVLSTVQVGDFIEYIPVTGTVQPRETVYLDAVDGGQIAEVDVEEGAFVKVGQPLVRLENAALQLQVLNSEAQVSEQLERLASAKLQFAQSRLTHSRELIDAKYQADEAGKRLARLKALAGTGVVKRADVEDAQLEFDRLQRLEAADIQARDSDEALQRDQVAQLDRLVAGLQRNLVLARQNLDHLVIRAPFNGQLTMLDAHLGESKAAGQRIGQVDRTEGFKVEALIDEHYLQRVSVGEIAMTEPDGDTPPRRFAVAKVYPQVTDRQFKVDLLPVPATQAATGVQLARPHDIATRGFRRGETVQLRLNIGGERKGLVVANGPFYDDTGGQYIFVLPRGGGVAHRRRVQLGRRNLEQIEVLGGLSPGERVIVSSYESFKDIDRITLTGGSSS
ncbi:MAG TPA: HlyD family efflux transporter periplasmic adaptor subunit [Steroidobacteraceae bacterium]|nr:HlyD family efflux transporter periplasmic adaptor subunit [Steroidobacteraceae bacterium]